MTRLFATFLCLCAAVALTGCLFSHPGRMFVGHVLDQQTGVPLTGVVVTACLLDKRPPGQWECSSTERQLSSRTSSNGAFQVEQAKFYAFGVPVPGGVAAYGVNLRFEKEGYAPKELRWWRDAETLESPSVTMELVPLVAHDDAAEPK